MEYNGYVNRLFCSWSTSIISTNFCLLTLRNALDNSGNACSKISVANNRAVGNENRQLIAGLVLKVFLDQSKNDLLRFLLEL